MKQSYFKKNNKRYSGTIKKYNRTSDLYDFSEKTVEQYLFKKFRAKAFKNLKGNILEIGVGTGKMISIKSEIELHSIYILFQNQDLFYHLLF